MRIVALAGMIAITTASIVAQGKPDRPATAAPPAGSAAAAIRQLADAYVKATTSGDARPSPRSTPRTRWRCRRIFLR